MRWLLVALVLLLGSPAHSQDMLLTGAGKPPVSYVGPLDIVPGAIALYSLRAGSAAIASAGTQSIVDLRRASDNATCTAKIATNGSVDLTVGTPCNGNTQTVTAWIGASSALVSKWYDQSGNTRDASQGTAANQPQLVLNSQGALPGVLFVRASNNILAVTLGGSISQPLSYSAVAKRIGSFTSSQLIVGAQGGGTARLYFNSVANQVDLFAGTDTAASATDSAPHTLQAIANGASSSIYVDGAVTNVSAGSGVTGTGLGIGGFSTSLQNVDGPIYQIGIYSGSIASSAVALSANDRAYYGF